MVYIQNYECLHNKLFKSFKTRHAASQHIDTWKFNFNKSKVYKAFTFHTCKKFFANGINVIQFWSKIHARSSNLRYFNAKHVKMFVTANHLIVKFNMGTFLNLWRFLYQCGKLFNESFDIKFFELIMATSKVNKYCVFFPSF